MYLGLAVTILTCLHTSEDNNRLNKSYVTRLSKNETKSSGHRKQFS